MMKHKIFIPIVLFVILLASGITALIIGTAGTSSLVEASGGQNNVPDLPGQTALFIGIDLNEDSRIDSLNGDFTGDEESTE